VSLTSDGPGVAEAKAADAPAAAQAGSVTGPTCVLKGTAVVPKGTQLFDAASGGRAIANFVGSPVPMQMSEIPADPANGRAKLVTSTGSSSVRIEGYVPASAITVYTTRDLPVMAGNVWITSAQKVTLARATQDAVQVELAVAGTRSQRVKANAACDALALQRGTPVPVEVPPNGRGYLTKEATVEIFDRPNGDAVFTLLMLEGSSQLFWSTETKAGFVHVKSRSDLALDGWIRWKDLDPLKKGEMMDQYIPPSSAVVGAQLVIDKPPPVRTATKEIAIRAKRDEKARPIGVVEAGAEIYVMETVAGWSNVLPKSLHVLPPDDGGFWIPSSEAPPL
jgi:hypothetical protein